MNFFEALKLLRSENSKLIKVAYISEDHARMFSEFFNFPRIFKAENGGQQKSVSVQKSKSASTSARTIINIFIFMHKGA